MQNGDPKATSVVSKSAVQHPPVTTTPVRPGNGAATGVDGIHHLSTIELVKQITSDVSHLAQKQVELAKAELKADLKSEVVMVGGLSVAAATALCTLNLLLVTVVLALTTVMPGWQAGLLVSAATLVVTAVVALLAWSKRVRSPMARTKRTLREDVQWTKERLV